MGNMKYYETDLDLVGDNKVLSGKITRHDTLLVERMYNLTSQNDEDVHHNEEWYLKIPDRNSNTTY